MAKDKPRPWLDEQHEIYAANVDEWKRNERRLRGGNAVRDELRKYDWERGTDPEGSYAMRQIQATYLNFPEMFATTVGGHLMEQAPVPDQSLSYGNLGNVTRGEGEREPSRAEQFHYNVDGVGADGSQLLPFVHAAWTRACATGHRWFFVEVPRLPNGAAITRADELRGVRPYLVEYSPVAVTNWEFARGQLQWAVVKVKMGTRVLSAQRGLERTRDGYMLLVRKGVKTFAEEDSRYERGGQFFFDADQEPVRDMDVSFDRLEGDIPLWVMYAARDRGLSDLPAMSRPLITDLGNAAISYMNLSSAADFDAWDAAKSIQFLQGVDLNGYNLAMDMIKQGSRFAPLTGPLDNTGKMGPVNMVDSATGAVTADVFAKRLEHKLNEAKWLAAREAIGEPGSSGLAKAAGFAETLKPRLVSMATELETWMNTMLYFVELRWTAQEPTGVAEWGKKFDLLALLDRIEQHFNLERLSGYKSATLGARAMTASAKENQLIASDEDERTVQAEYEQSAKAAIERQESLGALSGLMGAGGDTV